MNKTKAKALLERLNAYEANRSGAVSRETGNIGAMLDRIVEENIASVRSSIKSDPMLRAMEDMQKSIQALSSDSQIGELMDALNEASNENEKNLKDLAASFTEQVRTLRSEISSLPEDSQVEELISQLNQLKSGFTNQATTFQTKESLIQAEFSRIEQELSSLSRRLVAREQDRTSEEQNEATKAELQREMDDLRKTVMSRLATIGGGNMNRNFTLAGASLLTKYTDINLVAGSNMTITASTDNAKGTTNLTFASSGGGGGGNYSYNEVVAGSGTSWTLANTPINSSQAIYANGQRLTPTVDYSIAGAVITTGSSWVSGTVLADYQY